MSYGKDDFIDFNDLDLDALLGEYTCSEIECSDDEQHAPKKQKLTKDSVYTCHECSKKYSSISGIRGHLRSKHGATKVRVSDYRIKTDQESKTGDRPFHIEEQDFEEVFSDAFLNCVKSVSENSLRQKSSCRGKEIIFIAEAIRHNTEVNTLIRELLKPKFKCMLEAANDSDNFTNEVLFSMLYNLSINEETLSKAGTILQTISTNIRSFYGVLCHSLMKELVKQRSKLYEKANENSDQYISESDQQVLYYISGYLITALSRKCSKGKQTEKQKTFRNAMETALKNENDSEKTFVTRYSKWTEKTSRGGLKFPSDNFFLLIRECEIICRQEISEHNINKDTLKKALLAEKIMEKFMVRHYLQSIITGEYAIYILEKCVNLFLTVRGHAWARKFKANAITDKNNKKALRKVLKEKMEN